jgi:hypothetical protein
MDFSDLICSGLPFNLSLPTSADRSLDFSLMPAALSATSVGGVMGKQRSAAIPHP